MGGGPLPSVMQLGYIKPLPVDPELFRQVYYPASATLTILHEIRGGEGVHWRGMGIVLEGEELRRREEAGIVGTVGDLPEGGAVDDRRGFDYQGCELVP